MALHDRYLRRTPFELVFPDPDSADHLAEAVRAEATARGVDADHPHMFATLGAVGAFLRDLRGPEETAESLHPYVLLAFHGVRFAEAGRPCYLLEAAAARRLLAEDAAHRATEAGAAVPPARSGYLQLPQHLFWVEHAGFEMPESLDGLFWSVTPDGALHGLLVTGIRPDRPGLGVVPLPEAPVDDAPVWARTAVREAPEGADFSSAIPGAEIGGLYGIRTAGEALKLLARFFASVSADPSVAVERAPHAAPDSGGPAPSSHSYRSVGVDG